MSKPQPTCHLSRKLNQTLSNTAVQITATSTSQTAASPSQSATSTKHLPTVPSGGVQIKLVTCWLAIRQRQDGTNNNNRSGSNAGRRSVESNLPIRSRLTSQTGGWVFTLSAVGIFVVLLQVSDSVEGLRLSDQPLGVTPCNNVFTFHVSSGASNQMLRTPLPLPGVVH